MTTDRDRSIERLLRSRLPSEHKALDVDCPDAETLAGLADDTLIAVARHEVEAHVADCHRCQMLMAAMVRSEASMDRSAAEAAADAPSWRRRALNWLVPAAAAATAIALWVIVPGQRAPLPGGPTPERQIAVSAPAVPPEAPSSQTLQAPPETLRRESASAPVDARADAQAPARDASVGFERTAPAAAPAAAPSVSRRLDSAQQSRIANADTFFIGTFHPQAGADASHRGGFPGFVRVTAGDQISFPDYPGNTMFNTLGNLRVNPRAGLLFVDFTTGDVLQLTGRARVGDDFVVTFDLDEVRETRGATRLRFVLVEYSPANPGASHRAVTPRSRRHLKGTSRPRPAKEKR